MNMLLQLLVKDRVQTSAFFQETVLIWNMEKEQSDSGKSVTWVLEGRFWKVTPLNSE